MKNFKFKLIAACVCIIAFFMMLGWAGEIDFTEQVILSMSQEEYDSVRHHLTQSNGQEPSEREIAHWWVEHGNK